MGHYTVTFNNLTTKLNYNCKLNVGENSVLALGASAGIFLARAVTNYENSSEKVQNYTTSFISFGTSYSNKNFFIGFSVADLVLTGSIDPFYRSCLSIHTGYNWEFSERLSIEPGLFIKYGLSSYSTILLQNNFVFLKKYNLGGGLYTHTIHEGFNVFGGVTLKEKLKLNLAYKKFNNRRYRESQDYWLKESGLELSVSYQFN